MGQKLSCLQCFEKIDERSESDIDSKLRIRNVNANLLAAPGEYLKIIWNSLLNLLPVTTTMYTIVRNYYYLLPIIDIAIFVCKFIYSLL